MAEPTFTTGELLAVKMRNRRFGLIWVVGEATEGALCRVVGLDWFGKEPPGEDEAAAAELLHLSHPWYADLPFAARLIPSPKPSMIACGECEVSPEWLDFDFAAQQAAWKAIPATLYREYRWRHDPKFRAQVEALPRVGDTHAFELPEIGGWGASRVIAMAGAIQMDRFAVRRTIFGVRGRWDEAPTLAAVDAAREGAEPRFGFIATTDDLPEHFTLLGHLPPSAEELAQVDESARGSWSGIAHSVAHLWRLEHDEAYAAAIRARRYGATFAVPLAGGRFDLFVHLRSVGAGSLGLHVPARLRKVPEEGALEALLDGATPLWVRVDAPRPAALVYVGNAHPALDRVERNETKVDLDSWAPLLAADRYAAIDEWPRGSDEDEPPPTLAELAERTFFEGWEGHVEAADLKKSRRILEKLHRALVVGTDAAVAIADAVGAFNAIDDFIMTIEREDICDALWLYGRAAGLEDPQALIDEHRDW